MRKVLVCGVFLVVLCGCSINQQFVTAVDDAWDVIGPRYVEYVQKDATLDDESKTTRIRTAQLLTETIEEAKQ